MEKLDITKLGEVVTEYRDNQAWTVKKDLSPSGKQIAEKINEIIDWINTQSNKEICVCPPCPIHD